MSEEFPGIACISLACPETDSGKVSNSLEEEGIMVNRREQLKIK
jgi:hypothetical protein